MSSTKERAEDGRGPTSLFTVLMLGALTAGLLFLSASRNTSCNTNGQRGKHEGQMSPVVGADDSRLGPVTSAPGDIQVREAKMSRPARNMATAPIPSTPPISPVEQILGILSLWVCCVAAFVPIIFVLVYLVYEPIDRGMDAPWMALSWASRLVAAGLVGVFSLCQCKDYWKALCKSPLGLLIRLLILWAVVWTEVYYLAFALNCAFDFAPMNTWQTPIIRKIYQGPSGENSFSSYYFLVRDWKNPHDTLCLQVQEHSYDETPVGRIIRVKTHPGLWGAEWGWN